MTPISPQIRPLDTLKGKVLYLLVTIIFLNLTYPISLVNTTWNTIYVAAYAVLLGAGVYVASVNRQRFMVAFGVALATAILGTLWVLNPAVRWLTLATYLALIIFQIIIIFVLVEYIFHTRLVTRDILYAGITVYILVGDIFTPLFMTIETLQPGSFVSNTTPTVTWQQMVYYSYVTLTTVGYGDITPVTAWAQAFAVFEAKIGVLYVAILIGRLVGLFAQERQSPR